MRYSKDHKQETRDRIVRTAARRFREDGVEAVGVAALMADASPGASLETDTVAMICGRVIQYRFGGI